jgi:hypothetical protein
MKDFPIVVGRSHVEITAPAHISGVREGNELGSYDSMPGHLPDGRSTARRSTGINSEDRDPILPDMPNLSPA